MSIAILLAGGSGIRMGTERPKQFLKIGDREIWAHTTQAFQQSSRIDEIVIVCREDYVEYVWKHLPGYGLQKVCQVVAGGTNRYASAMNGLKACHCSAKAKVLICDAVRPCISVKVIDDVVKALDSYKFCDTGIPVNETLFEVENWEIKSIPDRSRFCTGQGPEGFHYDLLREILVEYLALPGNTMTNISGIAKMLRPDLKMGFVNGSVENIKITTKLDLAIVGNMICG
jgi:2-C-methyl-D-erythritol 4-phosphate cytidylyltransferase